jgi:hypothetical protein
VLERRSNRFARESGGSVHRLTLTHLGDAPIVKFRISQACRLAR